MTGFGAAEAEIHGTKYRLEIRSVNHRFLDLKLRMPRHLQGLESQIKTQVQARFTRGSLDLKLERSAPEALASENTEPALEVNVARAKQIFDAYQKLAVALGLQETISLRELANFPEVIRTRGAEEVNLQKFWSEGLETCLAQAMNELMKMRAVEGENLSRVLLQAVNEMRVAIQDVARRRKASEDDFRKKLTQKIELVFQAHPLPSLTGVTDSEGLARSLLESRLAQELALVLDRTDVQEELHRFEGHLAHFEKTLQDGGAVGRKLEFILQELGREINTLGNKAQDLGMSDQVVSIKVKLEQLREQVLNLE